MRLLGDTELHHNEWVSLRVMRRPELGIEGYVYSHETRCDGRIVAILPFRQTSESSFAEYLLRSEVTPCWGLEPVLSAITGGYEGECIKNDAVRELLEETGYSVGVADLIPLGESFASKSSDTVYSLFSVNLTGLTPREAIGDGSTLEAEGEAVWLPGSQIKHVRDPQVAIMYLRVLSHLLHLRA